METVYSKIKLKKLKERRSELRAILWSHESNVTRCKLILESFSSEEKNLPIVIGTGTQDIIKLYIQDYNKEEIESLKRYLTFFINRKIIHHMKKAQRKKEEIEILEKEIERVNNLIKT